MSAITAKQRRFSRQLRAACELYVISSAGHYTLERVFDVLTDPADGEMPAVLAGLLDRFPPATFNLDDLPLIVMLADPQNN